MKDKCQCNLFKDHRWKDKFKCNRVVKGFLEDIDMDIEKYKKYLKDEGINIKSILSDAAPLFVGSPKMKDDYSEEIEQIIEDEINN